MHFQRKFGVYKLNIRNEPIFSTIEGANITPTDRMRTRDYVNVVDLSEKNTLS